MSQLTDEQVKAVREAVEETIIETYNWCFYNTARVIELAQEKLKPLPSYGEVARNAYCEVHPDGVRWAAADTLSRAAEETGAQAVRRAVYEREIVPGIENVIEKLDVICAPSAEKVITDLRELIKEFV